MLTNNACPCYVLSVSREGANRGKSEQVIRSRHFWRVLALTPVLLVLFFSPLLLVLLFPQVRLLLELVLILLILFLGALRARRKEVVVSKAPFVEGRHSKEEFRQGCLEEDIIIDSSPGDDTIRPERNSLSN